MLTDKSWDMRKYKFNCFVYLIVWMAIVLSRMSWWRRCIGGVLSGSSSVTNPYARIYCINGSNKDCVER
jgi:hypothetical protein